MVTIYIEVSTTGLNDGDFSPLTSFEDTGAPFSLDDAPVVSGDLYIYRARRGDSETGLYSDWAYAYARPPYPIRTAIGMIRTQDTNTGSEEALYWAIEPYPGVPTKVTHRLDLVDGNSNEEFQRRYSRVKRSAITIRSDAVKGKTVYTASFQIEPSAEGGFPRMLHSGMKYDGATTLSTPTRYVHRYSNKKGAKTGTLIHKIGPLYKVYVGVTISNIQINPDFDGTDVLIASFDFQATGLIEFESFVTPTVETILGIATAGTDTLKPYAPDDGKVYINAVRGAGTKTFQWTLAKDLAEYRERDGTRAPQGHIEQSGNPTVSMTAYFNKRTYMHRYGDFGYSTPPTGPYGETRNIVDKPVSLVFDPPQNGSGFVNTLGIYIPHCDMTTRIAASGRNAVEMTISGSPLDVPGDASGTDAYLEITNSITAAQIVAPGTPIDPTTFTPNADREYIYGQATGTPTTTSISFGGTNPQISTVDDYYNGMMLMAISGALAGEEHKITDYVGSTQTFTTEAFTSAPSTDWFVVE